MNYAMFIMLCWVIFSSICFLGSFIHAFYRNRKFSNHIKNHDLNLWKDCHEQATVGIKIPFWIFNPFNLPKTINRDMQESPDFLMLKQHAINSFKILIGCSLNLFLSIIAVAIGMTVIAA